MNLKYRKAKKEDLDFLMALEKKAFPDFQQNKKINLSRAINSSFQEVIIVEDATTGNIPKGAAVLFKYKKTVRIYSIGIVPEAQNKGIGNNMLLYIKEYALKKHFTGISLEVRVSNKQLLQWYISNKFKVVSTLKDYYCEGEDALKLFYGIDENVLNKGHRNIIVIDQPYKWERTDINAKIISVKEYINNSLFQNNQNFRVFNLCSSYRYQSYGYYVSLLASARGQRVIPNITTIRDFRISNVIQSVAWELNELINKTLSRQTSKTFSLEVFFGQTPLSGYKTLASKLYQIFECPVFKVKFVKNEKWLIQSMKVLTFSNINNDQKELMYQLATSFFNKKRYNYPVLTNYQYDVAVLINDEEENPPSDKNALEKFRLAAHKKGVYLEFISREDKNRINEFDALFIRETTNVNHHTYEFSRLAYAEGIVVIDDPWSILRCSNKIYQYELFKRNKIRTPHTFALTKNSITTKTLDQINYPVVLKQPDSAFSLGVSKASNKLQAEEILKRLFKTSDMVVCQEFLYSEFDWRIGVLDNTPIFACKYYMTKDHWQIYNWASSNADKSGNFETVAIETVPDEVLKIARKAASLIGDGLYGVDIKFVNGEVYVIEVNDNPNIDAGVEDFILKDNLYNMIIDSLVNRIEIAKNIRKISLTSHK